MQPEDSILVWDDVTYRVTRYDSAGNFVGVDSPSRAKIAEAIAPPLYPGATLMLSSGELLVRLVEKSKDLPTAARFRLGSGALRVSPDMGVIDVLMRFGDIEQVSVESPWGPLPVVPAFAKNTSIAVQPGGARAIPPTPIWAVIAYGPRRVPEVRAIGIQPDYRGNRCADWESRATEKQVFVPRGGSYCNSAPIWAKVGVSTVGFVPCLGVARFRDGQSEGAEAEGGEETMKASLSLFFWIAALCLIGVSVVVLAVTLAQVVIGLIDSYGVWVVGGAAVAGIFIAGLSATVAWALRED